MGHLPVFNLVQDSVRQVISSNDLKEYVLFSPKLLQSKITGFSFHNAVGKGCFAPVDNIAFNTENGIVSLPDKINFRKKDSGRLVSSYVYKRTIKYLLLRFETPYQKLCFAMKVDTQ